MTDQQGNLRTLSREETAGDASGIGRRQFLFATGTAAAAAAGCLPGTATASEGTDGSTGQYGYGAQSYGEYGYGGVQSTN